MSVPHLKEFERRLVLVRILLDRQKKILDFAAAGLVIGTSLIIVGILLGKSLLTHIGTGMDYMSGFSSLYSVYWGYRAGRLLRIGY